MCPPACTPPRLHVDAGSTDEDVMLFLGRRKAGDPIPANVITEVNPFSLEPWDSPEGMWYLYNSEDSQSCIEGSIVKITEIGYWGPMDDLTIFADNVTAGRKTTREFYIGQEPFGNKTGWMMHEYHREQKACCESSVSQDYKSMCRVFLQNDKSPKGCDHKSSNGEQHGPFSSHNDDAEHVESMLMRFLEYEGRSSSTDVRDRSQASAGSEQVGALERQLASSNKSLQELNNISASELHSLSGFSMGEYLEINDLYDPESASSSEENSSILSLYSDDYFDPESLLGDIRSEGSLNMKEKATDYKFCLSASAKPGNVVIKPSQTGFVESNNSSPVGQEYMPSYTVPAKGGSSRPPSSSSPSELRSAPSAPASGSCMQIHPKRTHSSSSESSGSSNGSGSKSLGRIAKFGKKYCCLAPS